MEEWLPLFEEDLSDSTIIKDTNEEERDALTIKKAQILIDKLEPEYHTHFKSLTEFLTSNPLHSLYDPSDDEI